MIVSALFFPLRADNVCNLIRTHLDDIVRQAGEGDLDELNMLGGVFDLRFSPERYQPLATSISNSWQTVLPMMNSIASNRIERLLLMNTGWWNGESSYCGYMSMLSDLVASNQLDIVELKAFEKAAWNRPGVATSLSRRHSEVEVVNIVDKMRNVGFDTNYCSRIISGEIYSNYVNQVEDGLWR